MSQSQFTPPTAEDVRELVAKLRRLAPQNPLGTADPTITRAAALLEQRHPVPVLPEGAQVIEPAERTILVPARAPVPVSKRPWEREGWCDESGRCWMGDPGGGGFIPSWRLCRPEDAPNMKVSLPAHALPLPAGEVKD